jgi:hypothetical protein
MKIALKIVWVLYLVGLSSCGIETSRRRAVSTQKETKDTIVYFIKVHNAVHPLKLTVAEYRAMNDLKMDSVTVQKYSSDNYFETSDWKYGEFEGNNFLYVTVPFSNIVGINNP